MAVNHPNPRAQPEGKEWFTAIKPKAIMCDNSHYWLPECTASCSHAARPVRTLSIVISYLDAHSNI